MSDQARKIVRQLTGRRGLRAFVIVGLIALTGCFGPPAMNYDIQEYNKEALSSEKEMLLFNIGELHYKQPPHFMMLSSIAQTRSFSAGGSFQWSQVLNALTPTTTIEKMFTNAKRQNITRTRTNAPTAEGGTWQTGPFTAGTAENPTFQFVPLQGQDFAMRFESSLRDTFTLFLEDREWYATPAEEEAIVQLFAQSLVLTHGDTTNGGPCGPGLLRNDGYSRFSECVAEIVESYRNTELIDSSYPVPTGSSEGPKAADLVTALGAGYEFPKDGDKGVLRRPIRIPAWLDYNPEFVAPPESKPQSSEPLPPVWTELDPTKPPDWKALTYFLPKGYTWKVYKVKKDDAKSAAVYALVPDGYDLARDINGKLRKDRNGHYIPKQSRDVIHSAAGRWTVGSQTITDTRNIDAEDVGSPIGGPGISDGATILAVNATARAATMSKRARDNSKTRMIVGPHDARGTTTKDSSTITATDRISAEDIGIAISGWGIPTGTTMRVVNTDPTTHIPTTVIMSANAYSNGTTAIRVGAHDATGRWIKGSPTITDTENIGPEDEGSSIAGPGIPDGTTIKGVNTNATTHMTTFTMWNNANNNRVIANKNSTTTISVGDVERFFDRFSYGDEVVKDVWPAPQDYFYVELRKREADDATAKDLCHSQTDKVDPANPANKNLVCGYFKIGNLLQIMQRLAEMACTYQDEKGIEQYCSQSIFGIGTSVPSWAENSAPFRSRVGSFNLQSESVWVPAHNPIKRPDLAERDRVAFFTLYKLYQTSLVDTSKLVSGSIPITISK